VDVLAELKETPVATEGVEQPPGDADVFSIALQRGNIARELGLPARRRLLFSFRDHAPVQTSEGVPIRFLALGTDLFDRMLSLVRERWGAHLQYGAKYIDVTLPPGDCYLLWFLAAEARDGLDQVVDQHLFAVKQTPEGYESAAAAALIDLVPARDTVLVPKVLSEMAGAPQPVVEWSITRQQLPFLEGVQQQRDIITQMRKESLLGDAKAAAKKATDAYNELVFAELSDDNEQRKARELRDQLQARLGELSRQFDREGGCSLGPVRVLGAAAVFSMIDAPEEDLVDEKPTIAAAAELLAQQYEEKHGRTAKNVSGEHDQYPYDLHSQGPGGLRCIEVKGTTTGQVKLSENQRRAATKLGNSYYLYIVRDPLGDHPRLSIIRNPLSKMKYDDVLYSGARYVFNASTWQAAAEEETEL
jgi:hypothetical protein